jgi:hypothetical protein
MIFNITLFTSALTFANSTYAFGGFDNSEILRLIKGEKRARYSLALLLFILKYHFCFCS